MLQELHAITGSFQLAITKVVSGWQNKFLNTTWWSKYTVCNHTWFSPPL